MKDTKNKSIKSYRKYKQNLHHHFVQAVTLQKQGRKASSEI